MATNDLLFELGCEELPAQTLLALETSLTSLFAQSLKKAKLSYKSIESFATPRRLALRVIELIDKQPDQQDLKLGPNIANAYDDNNQPTKAGLGFAKSCGVAFEELATQNTDKGERLAYKLQIQGKKRLI
jgi:glycyl-tRNA synthetase beta chain